MERMERNIEALQERYIRWILGLDRSTPGYIIREESKIEQISIEAGIRAIKFQDKIKRITENKILKKCRREIHKKEWEKKHIGGK